MVTSYEEWAQQQPEDFQQARKVISRYETKREDERLAEEKRRADSLVGTYWSQYGDEPTQFLKVISVDGLRIKYLLVSLNGDKTSAQVEIREADPWIAREAEWKTTYSPRQISAEAFHEGIEPLLHLLV